MAGGLLRRRLRRLLLLLFRLRRRVLLLRLLLPLLRVLVRLHGSLLVPMAFPWRFYGLFSTR